MSSDKEENLDLTVNYAEKQQMDSQRSDLSRISRDLEIITHRLSRLESNQQGFQRESGGESSANGNHSARFMPHQAPSFNPIEDFGTTEGAIGPVPTTYLNSADLRGNLGNVQERFNVIKSTVDKVVLPTALKLHDSRSGIKKDDQPTLNVISKCARYIETALKLLSECEEGKPANLDPVVVSLVANIRYLQDEFAALLVKGRFDNSTSQLFRALQRDNSGFDSQSLQNVRIAAELASITPRQTAPFNRGRGFYNPSGRGFFRGRRGGFRGGPPRFPPPTFGDYDN